ncbi:MAG TPA: glycosyltransferase family 9 protein [Planctomycetes bacterium]|nr:glycosyltransferase family 9 protein [Planctomycetota bacterium]
MSQLPSSILIVRLGAIGDVTNALVLATAIKDASPQTRIGWAVHGLAAPLVHNHPAVDRVHVWERGQGLAGWRAVRDEVRAEGYELAVDLQRLFKSALLARASRAPRVLGFDRARTKECSWLFTRERITAGPKRAHMVDQYLEFARHLGLGEARARHVLPADPAADAWARGLVEAWGAPPWIMNLGASKPAKCWPAERFGQLAHALTQEWNAPVVFTGGREDQGAAQIATAAGPEGVVNLVGGTSLEQLIALLGHSRLFVGCDTGPMHLAVAQQVPVLALFGPGDPARTGPFGDRSRVVREPRWDPHSPFLPTTMEALGVKSVIEAIRELDGIGSGENGTANG